MGNTSARAETEEGEIIKGRIEGVLVIITKTATVTTPIRFPKSDHLSNSLHSILTVWNQYISEMES
jgi:hypothetical protein